METHSMLGLHCHHVTLDHLCSNLEMLNKKQFSLNERVKARTQAFDQSISTVGVATYFCGHSKKNVALEINCDIFII